MEVPQKKKDAFDCLVSVVGRTQGTVNVDDTLGKNGKGRRRFSLDDGHLEEDCREALVGSVLGHVLTVTDRIGQMDEVKDWSRLSSCKVSTGHDIANLERNNGKAKVAL